MNKNTANWYADWFGREYLELYPHRDDQEAIEQVAFVSKQLDQQKIYRILDIACGTGRHLTEFCKNGHFALGIDLSEELLRLAKNRFSDAGGAHPLARADMRELPFKDTCFDLVSSFFTSFGYFPSDKEHRKLLNEWSRVSVRGGLLILDYLNRNYVLDNLSSRTKEENAQQVVEQHRTISDDHARINKEIRIISKNSGKVSTFHESVRMYSEEELLSMVREAGYQVRNIFGSFSGDTFEAHSPRLILIAQRS